MEHELRQNLSGLVWEGGRRQGGKSHDVVDSVFRME